MNIISFVNMIILLLIISIYSSSFTIQPGIKVKIPKAITSDMIKNENVITISSENILYLNNAVITMQDLESTLNKNETKNQQLIIKANRRTSVGRVMDVWNLCRKIGIERINIATNQENE